MKSRMRKYIAPVVMASAIFATTACTPQAVGQATGTTSTEQVEAATARLADKMQDTIKWTGPEAPVSPPRDIKLTIVTCMSALYGCLAPAQAATKAAESLGWSVTTTDGQGDPSVQNRLIEQAVAGGADAILTTAVDAAFVRSGLAAAKAAGIPVVSANQGTAPSQDGFNVDVTTDFAAMGVAEADWMISDSKGAATVLPLIDREYEDIVDYAEANVESLKSNCPGCTVLPFESFVGTDVGNGLGDRVVRLLQRNPNINYILGNYDPACADITAAVTKAGLAKNVKMSCTLGDPQNLAFIRNGTVEHAVAAIDLSYNGYAVIDQLSRILVGQPLIERTDTDNPKLKYNQNTPFRIITAENVEQIAVGDHWKSSVDFVAKYETLWGLR